MSRDRTVPGDAEFGRIARAILARIEPAWTEKELDAALARLRETPAATADPAPRWQDSIIARHIPEGGGVLDLGCGGGELLARLMRERGVRGQGVELDPEAVVACVKRGVPVLQSDLDAGLRGFADRSFDAVILEETLQTLHRPLRILEEMLRVGRVGVVSFPNFGAWRVRLELALAGRMPVTPRLPHRWHNTPNIHLFTIRDFVEWIDAAGVRVARAYALRGEAIAPLAEDDNLQADEALFFLTR